MYRSDHAHMLDDGIDHPKDLLVSSKSRRSALVDTDNGDSVFVTGDFSGSMEELEREVSRVKASWPFEKP